MEKSLKLLKSFDPLQIFPKEISLYILSYLESRDLKNFCCVCRSWNEFVKANSILWRDLSFRSKWFDFSSLNISRDKKLTISSLKNSQELENIDWKKFYSEQNRIMNNWVKGNYSFFKIYNHSSEVNNIQFNESYVLTCSDDRKLKLWNRSELNAYSIPEREFEGHSSGVENFHFYGGSLVSAGSDGTIRRWDLETGTSLSVYFFSSLLRCIRFHHSMNSIFCSTSGGKILMVDTRSGRLEQSLFHHTKEVFSFALQSDTLISSGFDNQIGIWDLKNLANPVLTYGTQFPVTSVQFDDTFIISGQSSGDLRVWNRYSQTLERTIQLVPFQTRQSKRFGHAFDNAIWGLQFDNWKIVAGCDNEIHVLDLYSPQVYSYFSGHKKRIWSLQFEGPTLITASEDSSFNCWDLSQPSQIKKSACVVS